MTKLYVSYYGDFVSIVEGSYKKNKFNINDVFFMSSSDIEPDYSDKYKLLREALMLNQHKAKKVSLCLNTVDVIVKSNKIPKIDPNDLNNFMSIEIDELISLERDQYTFSYEVMKEFEEQGQEWLDLVLAGIETREVNEILRIFESVNLKLEYIDIIPTAYSRVLREIEYTDMMVVNTGEYSTSIDIYKDDSLYIHDNIPVRLSENTSIYDYMRVVDEANGLMNYYSSRNFGKVVDSILLIGKHANDENMYESFKKVFNSEVICGIQRLYDIYIDINGDILEQELNMVVEIIGCMLREKMNSPYYRMNLLPENIKAQIRRREKLKKYLKIAPIVLIVLYVPILCFNILNNKYEDRLNDVKSKIDTVKEEYKEIDSIEKDIKAKQDEIKMYDMLIKKEPKWGDILTAIDKNIPYKVQLENLNLTYVPDGEQSKGENAQASETEKNEQINDNQNNDNQGNNKNEEPIYDKIPNFISISGKASTPAIVGQFLYNLNQQPYFENLKLSGVTEVKSKDNDNPQTSYSFSITAKVKDGVIESE